MKYMPIIDPGHGGIDPGAIGNGITEKEMTLKISLYQYERFRELGVPVMLTRHVDKTLEPGERTAIVRDCGLVHCLSNHINAASSPNARGAQLIHSIYSNGNLAHLLADALKEAGQTIHSIYTRTLPQDPKKDYYFMHRETGRVETVIVEYGFLTSPEDAEDLKQNWQKYAEAVVKGFCQYIGHPYQPPAPADTLAAAVDKLVKAGVINTPEYWLENARPGKQVNGEYAAFLIERMAKELK